MVSSPYSKDVVATSYIDDMNKSYATLWNIETIEQEDANGRKSETKKIEEAVTFKEHDSCIHSILWEANEHEKDQEPKKLITADYNSILQWDLAKPENSEQNIQAPAGQRIYCVKRDPHHLSNIAGAVSNNLIAWDLVSSKETFKIPSAHSSDILSIDYNPNKPHCVVSTGQDSSIKFWDIRKANQPLKTIEDNSHWLWCVKYNRYHDQLLITSGSSTNASLWRVVSVCSLPNDLLNTTGAQGSSSELETDGLISTQEHDDTVYAVDWAAGDAWIYASISYNGTIVINHVPSHEKYKILL